MLNNVYSKRIKSIDIKSREYSSIYKKLNNKQKEAVISENQECLVVIACPGSGKTLTLTTKILYLLNNGYKSENILAITFTRKAAEEIKNRLRKDINFPSLYNLTVCNFHQLALRILRENFKSLGFPREFTVLDPMEQRRTIAICLKKLNVPPQNFCKNQISQLDYIDDDFYDENMRPYDFASDFTTQNYFFGYKMKTINRILSVIRHFKCIDNASGMPGDFQPIFKEYETILTERNAIDFDDMIPMALRYLEKDINAKTKYQNLFKYVLCDEFQDISIDQFNFLVLLSKTHRKMFVCGDDDQSIFGWRGGTSRCFQMIQNQLKCKVILIDQNYRSGGYIVKAYRELISNNKNRILAKNTWTSNKEGEKIRHYVCKDSLSEAKFICEKIKLLYHEEKINYHDIAVLSRTKSSLNEINLLLKKESIPVTKTDDYSQVGFFSNKSAEISVLLGYVELLLDSHNDKAFLKTCNKPKRHIGNSTTAALKNYKKYKNTSLFSAAQDCVLNKTHLFTKRALNSLKSYLLLISRLKRMTFKKQNIRSVLECIILHSEYKDKEKLKYILKFSEELSNTMIISAKKGIREQLSEFVGFVNNDIKGISNATSTVTLSTVHKAKGLQWKVVFLKTFNEGYFPVTGYSTPDCEEPCVGEMRGSGESTVEEERKIVYVGLSRASTKLYLSSILNDSNGTQMVPSRYLEEIPSELMEPVK